MPSTTRGEGIGMWGSRKVAVLFAAVCGLLLLPTSAMATLTIGSNLGTSPTISASCVGGCTYANIVLASGSGAPAGVTSPANGTVVAWRIRTGAPPAGMPVVPNVALRVIRSLGGGLYTGAGTSAPMAPPANATTAYTTNLPIAIGDLIGMDCCVDGFGPRFVVSSPASTRLSWLPLLAEGDPGRAPSGSSQQELAINAEIDPASTLSGVKAKPKKGGKLGVTVDAPNPGALVAGDASDPAVKAIAAKKRKLLKHTTAQVSSPGRLRFVVKPTKAAKALLAEKGKLKAKLKLVFTPTGGSAATQIVKVKLKG